MFSKPYSPTELFKICSYFNPFSAVCKTSYPSSIIIMCIRSIHKGFTVLPRYCHLKEIRCHYTFTVTVWPLQESGNSTHIHCAIFKYLVKLPPLAVRTPVTVIRSQKTNTIYSSWWVVDGINANDEDTC